MLTAYKRIEILDELRGFASNHGGRVNDVVSGSVYRLTFDIGKEAYVLYIWFAKPGIKICLLRPYYKHTGAGGYYRLDECWERLPGPLQKHILYNINLWRRNEF